MTIKPGAIRFNTDSMKLEIFRGSANYEGSASMAGIGTLAAGQWEEIQATSPDVLTGGTRGLIGGIKNDAGPIGYINFSTTGDVVSFGNLTTTRTNGVAAIASRTRAIFGGGNGQPTTEFVTIASTGNGTSFGNLINNGREGIRGLSNSTRGILYGGYDRPNSFAYYNVISYITIAATGNAIDFGDLTSDVDKQNYGAAMASSVRGVIGGSGNHPSNINSIAYVTISTLGNSSDFGDLTFGARAGTAGLSNSTRGIFAGADNPARNVIDYITIATLGNAQDFGDLTTAADYNTGGASPTRGVIAYADSPNASMDYIQIMSTGNAIEFGHDSVVNNSNMDGQIATNGHGGL